MIPENFPRELRCKRDFARAWKRGILGNRLRVWAVLGEVPLDYHGRIMLREVARSGGGSAKEYPDGQACRVWARDPERFMANECAPDHCATLQGEALILPGGFQLFAWERTRAQAGRLLRMRDALARASSYSGISALHLLRKHADPSSVEDIFELLAEWPDAVVEFSCYSRHLGNRSGRNTIIWEVRQGY
jgi:hypothetical protein